jgi:hypothetical protein
MSVSRPHREEGVVLVDIAEVVEQAQEKNGPWPEIDEPSFSSIPPERSNLAERVTLGTMAALLVAVTGYAIATGDHPVLALIIATAAGTLIRLTKLTHDKHKRGDGPNDSRAKRPPKKRRQSG